MQYLMKMLGHVLNTNGIGSPFYPLEGLIYSFGAPHYENIFVSIFSKHKLQNLNYTPNGYIVSMEFHVHFFQSIRAVLRRTKML